MPWRVVSSVYFPKDETGQQRLRCLLKIMLLVMVNPLSRVFHREEFNENVSSTKETFSSAHFSWCFLGPFVFFSIPSQLAICWSTLYFAFSRISYKGKFSSYFYMAVFTKCIDIFSAIHVCAKAWH